MPKGNVTSTSVRTALLLLVRDCVYVSPEQIYELSAQYGIGNGPGYIRKVVYANVSQNYLRKLRAHPTMAKVAFTITKRGLAYLEYEGYPLASVTSSSEVVSNDDQLAHYLGLTNQRIAMLPLVRNWVCERQVSSLRITEQVRFVKDYDAVVELQYGTGTVRIGIEYELSYKTKERYKTIDLLLSTERNIDVVLYLTNSPEMKVYLLSAMRECTFVCIATANEFLKDQLNTTVNYVEHNIAKACTFEQFIGRVRKQGRNRL